MRKLRQPIFAGVLGVFLIALAWFFLKPGEPSYQGKKLTAWLEKDAVNHLVSGQADTASVEAIRQLGTNAIPTLLRYAATPKDSWPKSFLLELKEVLPRLPIHLRSQVDSHRLAVDGFYVLGPDAKAAVPALTALLKDDDDGVRRNAAKCLGFIGPAAQSAVPDLIKEFEREMADTNIVNFAFYNAAFALGKLGPSARSAIPVLTSGLTHTSTGCSMSAQIALINLHAASFSPILDQLKATSNFIKCSEAMTIVSACGSNAAPTIPFLISALNSTNDDIQRQALYALGSIHQDPETCIPTITTLLASTNGQLRSSSIYALRKFGKAAKPATPVLIRCLNDPDGWIRGDATNALREIDPEAAAKAGIK